jgi:hypothetical protein
LTGHVVVITGCLAGRAPLHEAFVSSNYVWSGSARRFCPEEAGKEVAWNGPRGSRQGRVRGGTSFSIAPRSRW